MTLPAFLAWSCICPFFACINTSYSRTDEVEITNDLAHLIIGAFAHHGDAFYEHEVKRCLAVLKKKPRDFEARNDLGAAYTKLGQWKKAEAAFKKNEWRHPKRYKTASNLGVMFKKKGDMALAEKWIKQALKIKPSGHMGLGDYYLQMIVWRKQFGSAKPSANFLGIPYKDGPAASAAAANRQYVITLIKNDVNFADAYVVLGDILFEEGNLQLALRAYHRARALQHSNYSVSNDRIQAIRNVWNRGTKRGYVVETRLGERQIEMEFGMASSWLSQYQAIEAARLVAGQPVDFAAMKSHLANIGISRPRIIEAAYYRGTVGKRRAAVIGSFAAIVVLAVIAITLIIVRRKTRSSHDALKAKWLKA